MGLLDEAIREHLELKRRRGADAVEGQRQEKEAFGPPESPVAQGAEPEHGGALDEPGEVPAEAPPEPPTRLHVADATPDPASPASPAAEPVAGARPHAAELETEPPRPHGDPADRFPHSEPVADEPVQHTGQPTREFDL